ncbi:MAG TPA: iron chelate uptake ABC transporter family permease subunit, partial [bacterium]|nr:iron chelate uptake ABC transporter family permease subunit [bacterium]
MKNLKLFFFVIFLTILVLSVSPFIGKIINNSNQYIFSIFDFSEQQKEIIYNIRLPQTLMAFFTGFALAVCGLMYQTIFQNDLASPYTLGVSSGAAVAAVISIKFNIIFNFAFFSNIGIFAFLGGILTLTLLFFF